MEPLVLCEKKEWGALVTLNRPQALNALNPELMCRLDTVLTDLDQDDVSVIIITGSGSKAFAAGADIASMKELTPEEARKFSLSGQAVMNRIARMDAVVIAAVNGYALGGGCELALACDIRIASERAKFGIPEVTLGVIPGFGGTQRLARLVGVGKAMELLVTGKQIKAEEALKIGLVNEVAEADKLMETAEALAAQINSNSTFAVSMGKRSIYTGIELPLEHGLSFEADQFALTFAGPDQREGMSAFLEKRKANFQ